MNDFAKLRYKKLSIFQFWCTSGGGGWYNCNHFFCHIWSPNIKVSGLGDSENLGKGLWFKQYPWDAHCSVWFTQRKKSQIQCQPQSPGPFGRVLRLKWYSALSVPGATSHLHSATTFWGSLWNWGGSLCHSGTCPSSFIPVNLHLKKKPSCGVQVGESQRGLGETG